MKTKLVSISRTNLLYMPILKLNLNSAHDTGGSIQNGPSDYFYRLGPATYFATDGKGAANDAGDNKFFVAVS